MSAADIARRLKELGFAPVAGAAWMAQSIAARHGQSLQEAELRLFDASPEVTALPSDASFLLDPDLSGPDVLGEVYERMLADAERHRGGVHYTPRMVAEGLIAAATTDWPAADSTPLRILDPSVGAGAFLLAAARWRHDTGGGGASRVDVCRELLGRDIDQQAIAVAEAALALWCIEAGEDPIALPGLTTGDIFVDALPTADLIVGNPPFLSQLDASTAQRPDVRDAVRDRFAIALGPYADTASVFVLAGQHALADHGRMVLIQPVSFLASRDVAAVRDRLSEASCLLGLWFSDEALFDASVQVCAPVIAAGVPAPADSRLLRWTGRGVTAVEAVAPPVTTSWGPAVSDMVGIPLPTLMASQSGPRVLGDLATATAGFRDQFYGFAPLCREDQGEEGIADSAAAGTAHLVTTGMIDPLRNRWGTKTFRFAKQTRFRPVVPLVQLQSENAELAAWTEARLRPKLLLATQTKVLEVAVDQHGSWIPVTPLISVEPRDDVNHAVDQEVLWRIAAALSAPALSALAIAEQFGAALMVQAIKLSAAQVLALPLPADNGAWRDGAAAARRASEAQTTASWSAAMADLGIAMTAAYGSSEDVLVWWTARIPNPDRT